MNLSPEPWTMEIDLVNGRYFRIYSGKGKDVSVCRVYREADAHAIAVVPALVRIAVAVRAGAQPAAADLNLVFHGRN